MPKKHHQQAADKLENEVVVEEKLEDRSKGIGAYNEELRQQLASASVRHLEEEFSQIRLSVSNQSSGQNTGTSQDEAHFRSLVLESISELKEKVANYETVVYGNSLLLENLRANQQLIHKRLRTIDNKLYNMVRDVDISREQSMMASTLLLELHRNTERNLMLLAQSGQETGEQPEVTGCLKILLILQKWELDNLPEAEYHNRASHYDEMRAKWISNQASVERGLVLTLDTGAFLPSVAEMSVTLHPTIHARLCEEVTVLVEVVGLHIRIPQRDSNPGKIFWPNVTNSIRSVRHMEITVENPEENLSDFMGQFENLKSMTINRQTGEEESFWFPANLSSLSVLYMTGDRWTKFILDYFSRMCSRRTVSKLIVNPRSVKVVEDHFSFMVEKQSENFEFITVTVSKKYEAVYLQMVERVSPSYFLVSAHETDDDSNTVEINYYWNHQGIEARAASRMNNWFHPNRVLNGATFSNVSTTLKFRSTSYAKEYKNSGASSSNK